MAEQDKRTRRDVPLDQRLGHPDELEHRAEPSRQENPGIRFVPQSPQASREVRLPYALGQPVVPFAFSGEQDAQANPSRFGGAPAGRLHEAGISAADDAAPPARDLASDLPRILVRRAPLPRQGGAEDANGDQALSYQLSACEEHVPGRQLKAGS